MRVDYAFTFSRGRMLPTANKSIASIWFCMKQGEWIVSKQSVKIYLNMYTFRSLPVHLHCVHFMIFICRLSMPSNAVQLNDYFYLDKCLRWVQMATEFRQFSVLMLYPLKKIMRSAHFNVVIGNMMNASFGWARATTFPISLSFFLSLQLLKYYGSFICASLLIHYLLPLRGAVFFYFYPFCLMVIAVWFVVHLHISQFVTFSNDPCPAILETVRFGECISNHRVTVKMQKKAKRVDRIWNWILRWSVCAFLPKRSSYAMDFEFFFLADIRGEICIENG